MSRLPSARVDIKLVLAELQGRQVLRVEDGVIARDEALTLELETFQQLLLFDGQRSLADLRQLLCEQHEEGHRSSADAEQVVRELDAMLLLQTPRYHARLAEVRRAYAALPTRTAALAGAAYPAQPAALRAQLDRLLTPGVAPNHAAPAGSLRAIVAPHVDLNEGRRAYAAAYGALARAAPRPDRLILLGTGHALDQALLSCTTKDYQTPLGLLPTDRTAVQALRRAAGALTEEDDFAHRDEHALELQLVFLQHLLPSPVPTLPLLIGPVDDWLSRVDRLAEIPGAAELLQALSAQITPRTLLVASADLCHVGRRYGDEQTAREQEAEVAEHEARLLDALCRGSAAALWAEARRVDDQHFRVCGLSSLALTLELLEQVDDAPCGEILSRVVLHDDPSASAVSCAAAAIYR